MNELSARPESSRRAKPTVSRCRAGARVIGTSFDLGSPAVVEAAALAPLDWCVLDWEHGLWNETNLPPAIQALASCPMACVVRVPSVSGPWIKKALDWGADGVLVPNVRNLEEARACVAEAKYAPLGRRGVGAYRPSKFYTDLNTVVASGNDSTLLWLMIETASLVDDLDAVCALPGVDGFVVGRNDLAQSRGRAYADSKAETDALAERAMDLCVKAGKAVGCFSGDPAEVARWAARGVSLLTVGDDAQFIRDGMAAVAVHLGADRFATGRRKEY